MSFPAASVARGGRPPSKPASVPDCTLSGPTDAPGGVAGEGLAPLLKEGEENSYLHIPVQAPVTLHLNLLRHTRIRGPGVQSHLVTH